VTLRTALVTGGSGGIGKAVCLQLAKDGYGVVVHHASTPDDRAQEVVRAIEQSGGRAVALCADVRDEAAVQNLIDDTIKHFGRLDLVVNNAGVTRDRLMLRMSLEDWQQVLDVNLTGAFLVSRAAVKIMLKARQGKIVNVSSVVGIGGNAGQANYSASKAGLIGLTKSMAKELASRGITCNAVAPGFIDAGMAASLSPEVKDYYLKNIPQNRAGSPEDVAFAISFLASSQADYITGQVLRIDGGMSI
jgi:3-oxoacyl-[acyl-carrier protein] reductase